MLTPSKTRALFHTASTSSDSIVQVDDINVETVQLMEEPGEPIDRELAIRMRRWLRKNYEKRVNVNSAE